MAHLAHVLLLVLLVAGCSAQRTKEDCKFKCKDCKDVSFECPYRESSVDVITDVSLPIPTGSN